MIKFYHKELIIPYFILFVILLLSIYPLLYMISTSLMTAGEASNQYMFPKKLMFENYLEVWNSNNFQKYTFNSIIISVVIVTGVLCTSIPAAYAFAKIDFPFRNIIFYGLLISLMIPEIISLLLIITRSPHASNAKSRRATPNLIFHVITLIDFFAG